MNICIIGFGSIGRTLARALNEVDEVNTIFIIEKKPAKVKKLEEELTKIRYSENYDDVLEDCRLVVETAAQDRIGPEHDSPVVVLADAAPRLFQTSGQVALWDDTHA